MLKSIRPWWAFAMVLILTAFSRPQVGDLVELEQLLNGRAQARFRLQDKNLIRVLAPGTKALVKEVKLFYSGNYGLRIHLIQLDGGQDLQDFWVYYNVKSPRLRLFGVSTDLARKQELLSNWQQNSKFEPVQNPTKATTAIVTDPVQAFMASLANQPSSPAGKANGGATGTAVGTSSGPTFVFVGGRPLKAAQAAAAQNPKRSRPTPEPKLDINPSQMVAALRQVNEGAVGTGPNPYEEILCLRSYDTRTGATNPSASRVAQDVRPSAKPADSKIIGLTAEKLDRDLKILKISLEQTTSRAQALELLDAYQNSLKNQIDQLTGKADQKELLERMTTLNDHLELLKKAQCPGIEESLKTQDQKKEDKSKDETLLSYALELAAIVCAKK